MHVAIVCRDAGGTGSVALVALRHAALLAREFRVTIVSDSLPAELPDGVQAVRISARLFDMFRRFAHVPNEIAFASAARFALLKMDDLDFVLCEGDVPAAIAARPLKRRRGTPFGIVTHGDMAGRPKGTFDPRLSALYRWAEARSAAEADLVIALGPTTAELARRRGGREVVIVPNGLDVILSREDGEGPAAQERRGSFAALRMTYVGRLAIEKGVLVLMDAARILRERGVAFQLTIVGSGPLEREMRERKVDVEFAGPQPHDEIGKWFQAADVVVVPSFNEPFGLVIIEALAAGTPVIASDVDDIPTIVRDRENGLLVPVNDARALADAIELLANDRQLLSELRNNAHPSVWPRFSWEESGRLLRDAVRSRLRHNR